MKDKINATLNRIEGFNREVPSAIMPKTTAKLLKLLILSTKSKKILEIGCSIGYSAIWMASAAKELGGHVYTMDKSEDRSELARINFENAGLSREITLFEGDAMDILKNWKNGPMDFILIDAMKKQYLDYYKLVFPLLNRSGMIVADDVNKFKEKMKDFLEYVKKDKRVYSTILNIDDGVIIIYKK